MTPSLPLPPAAPEVVASAVEGLTGRLRGRLDAAVASLTDAPVTTRATDDGAVRVRCGEDVWVTLAPGPDGALTRPEQAVCTCLLSPRCLHRAAVLTACPVSATHHATAVPPEPAATPPPTAPAALSARRTRAATGLWTAAAAVLAAGTSGAGAVLQSELLRAAHTARLADLHRDHLHRPRDPPLGERLHRGLVPDDADALAIPPYLEAVADPRLVHEAPPG